MKHYSIKEADKLLHPLFIISLCLLIVNDWYFKMAFHNEITGKLSDFAGLFAFPFLFSLLFPKNRKFIHFSTAILFILWNSTFSQPLIHYLNGFEIPIGRTIDITDNIALISIIASYQCLNSQFQFEVKPFIQKALIAVSCLAFIATTLPPRENRKFVDINKEYHFDFSKRELVSRLNMVQVKKIYKINKLSRNIDFNSETNAFHYKGRTDTLALILDYNKIRDQDIIEFKTSYAEILLTGNDNHSTLKLLATYKVVQKISDKDFREKTIKQFEKHIVKKVEKYE